MEQTTHNPGATSIKILKESQREHEAEETSKKEHGAREKLHGQYETPKRSMKNKQLNGAGKKVKKEQGAKNKKKSKGAGNKMGYCERSKKHRPLLPKTHI